MGSARFDVVTSSPGSVVAAVIAYLPRGAVDPGFPALLDGIRAVAHQVQRVLVVDNSPASLSFALSTRLDQDTWSRVEVLDQAGNRGVAAAANAALSWAQSQGVWAVLLLDQDSLAQSGCVDHLRAALAARGEVAAVGATQVDPHTNKAAPFIRVRFPMSKKMWGDQPDIDFLISSGCLIRVTAWQHVGPFRDDYFIDNVDLEWSFRAKAAGWLLSGVDAARLNHVVGPVQRTIAGRYRVAIHPPLRLYFIMRNRVLLYREPATPAAWKAQDVPRLIAKMIGFAVFVRPRWENFVMMTRGLADGIRGRTGPGPAMRR